jgi:hypothetical protein
MKMETQIISTKKMRLLIQPLIGLRCCRKQIGYRRSLSVGFGKKIPHDNLKARDRFYGEWEIMTYDSEWRVIRDGVILCASHDTTTSLDPNHPPDLDRAFQRIPFGRLSSIRKKNTWDMKITFDSGISIDLFGAASHGKDGDFFHIFCPWGKCISIDTHSKGKWIYEDSRV